MLVYNLGRKGLYRFQQLATKLLSGQREIRIVRKIGSIRNGYFPDLFADNHFLNYVAEKKTGFEHKVAEIEHLALRASTADYAFYPDIWPGAFNLGLTSTDLYISFNLYQLYREKLKKLKNVILFYSVSANGYSMIMTTERYRAVAYKYYFHVPYQHYGQINNKLEKGIHQLCENLKVTPPENSYKGYRLQTIFSSISPEERVRTHLRENTREPDQLQWLEKLYNSLHNDGRKLIIVIPPFRSDYTALLPDRKVVYEKLFKLDLGETEIIDLSDSASITDQDFGDTDHLNENGAIKLTSELYKILGEKGFI